MALTLILRAWKIVFRVFATTQTFPTYITSSKYSSANQHQSLEQTLCELTKIQLFFFLLLFVKLHLCNQYFLYRYRLKLSHRTIFQFVTESLPTVSIEIFSRHSRNKSRKRNPTKTIRCRPACAWNWSEIARCVELVQTKEKWELVPNSTVFHEPATERAKHVDVGAKFQFKFLSDETSCLLFPKLIELSKFWIHSFQRSEYLWLNQFLIWTSIDR